MKVFPCVRWMAAVALVSVFGVLSFRVVASGYAAPQTPKADMVKRGDYLVSVAGCHDCHTPHKMGPQGPEPDMSLALTGHQAGMTLPPPPASSGPWIATFTGTMTAWAGPWGVSYTANLTPDRDTGLGNYTEEQFIQTIRDGKKQGRGRALLPPMPWPAYRNFSDEDLKAIFAYLQSLKPTKNKVPDPIIPEAK
jgi:mono/diheme cytochrome c family protein